VTDKGTRLGGVGKQTAKRTIDDGWIQLEKITEKAKEGPSSAT